MRAWDLIMLLDPNIVPAETKVHLAVNNGWEDPFDVYSSGAFGEWQARQGKRNFQRPFVIAFIQLREPQRWLFAGVYSQLGYTVDHDGDFIYRLNERPACKEINGRLVVNFQRPGRQSYLRTHVKIT